MVSDLKEKLRKFARFFYGVSLFFKKKNLKIYLYFNIFKLKVTLKKYRTAKRTQPIKIKACIYHPHIICGET